jgi:hypothetical protein
MERMENKAPKAQLENKEKGEKPVLRAQRVPLVWKEHKEQEVRQVHLETLVCVVKQVPRDHVVNKVNKVNRV